MRILLVCALAIMALQQPVYAQDFSSAALREIETASEYCKDSYLESRCNSLAKIVSENPTIKNRLKTQCDPSRRAWRNDLLRSATERAKQLQSGLSRSGYSACNTEVQFLSAHSCLKNWRDIGECNPVSRYSLQAMSKMEADCNSGKGERCHQLGEGYILRQQKQEALEAKFKACRLKFKGSDIVFGRNKNACAYVYEQLGDADNATVDLMLETVATNYCELDREGCISGGSRYQSSNPLLALDYATLGCNAKVYELCTNVGIAYIKGGEGIERNANLGLQLLRLACDEGTLLRQTVTACYTFGTSIDQLRKKAAVPESTLNIARTMLKRSCDLEHTESCDLLNMF